MSKLVGKSVGFLPRSKEALTEAAYHIVFSPRTNLKGRQQLRGRYEGNEKREARLSLHLVCLLSSSATLACFHSQVRPSGKQFPHPLEQVHGH